MESPFKFLFFGCWNRDDCETDYRGIVLDKIAAIVESADLPVDMAIIAGDNIYPHKEKGLKTYYMNTLQRGFDKLSRLSSNIDVYAVVGNHNVATESVYAAERGYVTDRLHLENFYRKEVADKDIWFHFLDTTVLFGDDDEIEEDLVDTFMLYLKEGLAQHVTGWNIIIAHHPIVLLKKNIKFVYAYETLLDILKEAAAVNPRIVYMCADVHNFHVMELEWKDELVLPMVVSGTGGAASDDIRKYQHLNEVRVGTPMATLNLRPRVWETPYGFCSVEVHPNKIYVSYHQVVRDGLLPGCNIRHVEISMDPNHPKLRVDVLPPEQMDCGAPVTAANCTKTRPL